MRIYTASSEETLRARKLLKEWTGDGVLTKEQHQRLEQETVSELRTTNIFLRMVLFLFTLISVGAAAALFFVVFLASPPVQTSGMVFLIFGAICYAAAEAAVSRARLHHYGIEEALAVCSIGFLCGGLQGILFTSSLHSPQPHGSLVLVPAAGIVFSLWVWHRFGLWYAFLAAMIFTVLLPGHWTLSHAAQHAIVAIFYAAGLICIAAIRFRRRPVFRHDYLDAAYSLAEALLWLGTYLAINLKISSLGLPAQWRISNFHAPPDFAKPFYWSTWVLTWCLPPVVLARGIRQKDRFVIAVGMIAAILTLVTNKPYLGWPRHTWDPMLLGILLAGAGLFVRRWLARGPGGVRHGFTAARLSGKDKQLMDAGSAVLGLVSPQSITPSPQSSGPDVHFGGGSSGGGGASGEF